MVLIDRVAKGVAAVLPPRVVVSSALTDRNGDLLVRVAKELLRVRWLERGSAIVLQTRLSNNSRPDLVMAAHMSSAAQLAAIEAGVGWLDETGAAQFAVGTVVVSRTSVPRPATAQRVGRWTAATLGITEALLTGVPGTVQAQATATGVSPSTAGLALNFLTHTGLLTAAAVRGRKSGRNIADPSRLLEEYADAVTRARDTPRLHVGVLWRDPLEGLSQIGRRWDGKELAWAATGALSAATLAPLQSQVAPMVVYVDANGLATLAAAASTAGLRLLEGGRLQLRPFPTPITRHLSAIVSPGLRSVTWPRAYADLRDTGVRGEEAAEHLREVMTRERG
jgi:hypothetical protein